jgi:hypothetical protein
MRIRPSLRAPFLALALGAVVGVPAAVQAFAGDGEVANTKAPLAARMEKGQVIWFRQKMKQDADIDMGGMQMSNQMEMNQVWSQTCDSVDDKGVMAIRMKFAHVWGAMTNPMFGEVKFDSDNPDAGSDNPMLGQMAAALTKLAGTEMSGSLNPNGTMTGMKMSGEASADPAEKQMAEQLEKQLQGISTLPDKPVGVGDTWTVKTDMNLQGLSLTVEVNNKVTATDGESVTVAHDGKMSMSASTSATDDGSDPRAAAMREMMSKMKIKDSVMKGTSRISRKDGLVLSSNMEQEMTMEMELPPEAAEQGMGGGMQMKQKIHMTIDRTDAPAPKAEKKPAETPAAPPATPPAGEPKPETPAGPGGGEK